MEQIRPKNKLFIDWLKEHMGHELGWNPFFVFSEPYMMVFIFACKKCNHNLYSHKKSTLEVISQSVYHWFKEHIKHRKRWRVITFKQDISLMIACECGEKYTIKISE